jgi:hypothetical protein
LLSINDFLIVLYNFLEGGSPYRSDLVSLFGNPDGSRRGYLGSTNKPICWDWGTTGFGKLIKILYSFSRSDQKTFSDFYESKIRHAENIVQTLIAGHVLDGFPHMLYVFKHSSKKIPAFIAAIHEISWKKERIHVTFEPKRYLLLDPTTWKSFWQQFFTDGREDPKKWFDSWEESWSMPRPPLSELESLFKSSFSQDQYHVISRKFLVEYVKRRCFVDEGGTCFTKDIEPARKRLALQVPTDNQTFWGTLSEFIGRTQVKGRAELDFARKKYTILDIPANTISEDSLVFKQEVGAAATICQAMLDVFGQEYLNIEFQGNISAISLLDSKFLKRAVKISMVARNYERKYAETDFDYQLDLSAISKQLITPHRVKLLFDLTAGLWNKGIGKTQEEFVQQWEHNLVRLPEKNDDIFVFWHYGLTSEVKDGSYKGQELGNYLQSKANIDVTRYSPNSIKNNRSIPRTVLLSFYRDSKTRLETELGLISSNKAKERRKSNLYGALKEFLERFKA